MLQAHMPPATAREALHALFGDDHAGHTVLTVDWRNLGVAIHCSCAAKPWYVDSDRAAQSGLTFKQLRKALANAPRKPEQETRSVR